MASYQTFTSARATPPDPVALLASIRTAVTDATAGVSSMGSNYTVKKTAPFSAGDTTATQSAIDSAPALTPERQAQNDIDAMTLFNKAILLTLLDQINVLRANDSLAAVTPSQAISAVRTKAGTL